MTSRRGASSVRCVMKEPAKRKTDADAHSRINADVTAICCGKGHYCPVLRRNPAIARDSHAENKRPDRGDNRSGGAIRALGVDGRSRLIQLWGGKTAPTLHWSPPGILTFKRRGNFFNPSPRTVSCASLLRSG